MTGLFAILGISNGAVALALGIFTLVMSWQNPIYRSFGAFATIFGIWFFSNSLPIPTEFTRLIALAAASFAVTGNLYFVQKLAIGKNVFLTGAFFILGIILFGTGATITNLVPDWSLVISENGSKIWVVGFLATWVAPIFWLFFKSQETIGTKKYQLWLAGLEHLVFLGASVGSFFLLDNPALSIEENIIAFPNIFGAIHVAFIFYFFVEYNFLKLKIILPGILKKAIGLGLATIIAVNFQLVLAIILPKSSLVLRNIMTTIVAVLVFTFAIQVFDLRQLFKTVSFETFRKIVNNFRNQNIFYASLDDLKKNVQENFADPAGIELAKVIVLDLENSVAVYPELEKYFAKNTGYLVTVEEEYLQKNKGIQCPHLEELQMLGDVVFPLFQNTNELIGFFAIRRNTSDNIYVEEELKLIESAVHYVSLSLMGIIYTEKLKEQSEKLRDDYQKLKTLDDAKDAFIANVSHELRTPATAIKGYLEMLVAPNFGELGEKQKDFVRKIQKNTNWLIDLLNDILMITKLDSEKIDFKIEAVPVRPFFESLGAKWEAKIAAKKLRLELAEPQSELILITDPKWLEEILDRLLGNALKFTEKGRIKISAEKVDDFLAIKIGDTGVGISRENLEKIFDKFFQTKNYLEKGDNSTGLGLAIAKKIVENLNGSISIESEIGVGSTFQILIPLQNA